MAAYLIGDVEITDPAGLEEYRRQVPATIAKHGGKYLVRGGNFEVVEGSWTPNRMIVLEFESMEQAKRWYNSPEYSRIKLIRQKSANTNVIFVQGV